jgi:F420H(2)-dependent quinone reductase
MGESERKPFLPPRWFIRLAWAVHRAIYRVTGGRRGLRPPTPRTYGLMRIHTVGRRSGAKRTAILGYFEDGPNLFTLAMNGWGEPEPAWWLNLQADPDATLDLPDGQRSIRARGARPPVDRDAAARAEPGRLRLTANQDDAGGRVRASRHLRRRSAG